MGNPVASLLRAGLRFLRRSGHETSFRVEMLSTEFFGLIEDVRTNNELGEGGFTPAAAAFLYVERGQFWFRPWTGMRVFVMGNELQVQEVGGNDYRWALQLAHTAPAATSDLPDFQRVLSSTAGTILFGTSNSPISIN